MHDLSLTGLTFTILRASQHIGALPAATFANPGSVAFFSSMLQLFCQQAYRRTEEEIDEGHLSLQSLPQMETYPG